MLASMLARPLQHADHQHADHHHIAIALVGRIIRTASICATFHTSAISTDHPTALLVTHALEDIAILAPALPTSTVDPLHRDILITTNADKISAVNTLAKPPIDPHP